MLLNCEIKECSNSAEHTHHILEQRHADENGFVGHVRVNHVANLVGLCESCHNKVHKGKIDIRGYIQTSQGFYWIIQFIKIELQCL